jgi:hypothetical protein
MANQIRTIELRQINPTGKSLLIFRNGVKPRNQKYFASYPTQISSLICAVPCPQRGVSRSSRTLGRGCGGRGRVRHASAGRRMMLTRTAKSCGSDAPMPASSLREAAQATVSNKPGHREEREVSRKTIARGMPGRSGVTVVTTLVCSFLFCMRGCGRVGRPAFPAPSILGEAKRFLQTSGASRRGSAESYPL